MVFPEPFNEMGGDYEMPLMDIWGNRKLERRQRKMVVLVGKELNAGERAAQGKLDSLKHEIRRLGTYNRD